MDEDVIRHVQLYASVKNLSPAERLGFGIHGIIFAAYRKSFPGKSAIKAHRSEESYHRELAIYQHLEKHAIKRILNFKVPQLLSFDHSLLVIEMTIVTRPFLLDFAGAYLDKPPDFPAEIWNAWQAEKHDQFGPRWSKVEDVLFELRNLGVHMIDVSPSNIAF